ncbi:MAG: 5-formyltetrahydrofolate cyclo-ligase [Alsobacter sp.]
MSLSSPSAARDKDALRKEVLARRDALTAGERARASQLVADRFEALHALPFHAALHEGPVSVFLPIRSELDTRPLMRALERHGVTLALPVVRRPVLDFRVWQHGQPLVKAAFGLLEPGPEAASVRPRTMLVPLAAFDRRGDRIGYGAGHYDRAIEAFSADGRPLATIGVAFSCQEVARVPAEPHDRRLDWILTETELIRTGP